MMISKQWRELFVNKLHESYGLPEEEASKKADSWLDWIGEQPNPQAPSRVASDFKISPRRRSRIPSKLNSRATGPS